LVSPAIFIPRAMWKKDALLLRFNRSPGRRPLRRGPTLPRRAGGEPAPGKSGV
jgi:hypothetical protein